VQETDAWERLRQFRQELYDDLGLRQASLVELLDALLTTQRRSTLVRLSFVNRLSPSLAERLRRTGGRLDR